MNTTTLTANEDAERAILGRLLEDNRLLEQAAALRAEDFSNDTHRIIFRTITKIVRSGSRADIITVGAAVSQETAHDERACVSALNVGLPQVGIAPWVATVQEAAARRHALHAVEAIQAGACDRTVTREQLAEQFAEASRALRTAGTGNWRSLFHTADETFNAPPLKFAIEGFLQEEAITIIGGLAGHGKTMLMLNIVKSLLEGHELFNYFPFKVPKPSERVLYLIPESSLGPFVHRLKLFGLLEAVREGRLFYRTLSFKAPMVALEDPRILEAAQGSDVFLDTAIRFMDGDENSAEDGRRFARVLFNLQQAGARTIVGAHHSPKNLGHAQFLTLENVLRGSGDIGAMIATCWGIYQTNAATNEIVVKNVKPRDFQPCEEFRIQGRPHLDEKGYFQIVQMPGEGEPFNPQQERGKKGGRPEGPSDEDKFAQALKLLEAGETVPDVAAQLGVSERTIQRWNKASKKVQ